MIAINAIIVVTVIFLLWKCSSEQLISAVPVFVTAFGAFISSIVAVPLSVTKYLFSTCEDEYITQIISHTQEHDLSGRKLLKPTDIQEIEDIKAVG